MIDRIFRHAPIGCPFSAGDGQQAAAADLNGMITGQCGGSGILRRFHQRANPREHADNVRTVGRTSQILPGGFKNKINFRILRYGFQGHAFQCGVGCAQEGAIVPWDGKQHSPIAGVRHHDGGIAGKKRFLQHQMHPLAGRNNGRCAGVVHVPQLIAEGSGCVDDTSCRDGMGLPRFAVGKSQRV